MLAYRVVGVRGSMARELKSLPAVRPVYTAVHVLPLLTERNTVPMWAPAYKVEGVAGLMARHSTYSSVRPMADHVSPLFVERNTPPWIPTYRLSLIHISEPTRLGMISY